MNFIRLVLFAAFFSLIAGTPSVAADAKAPLTFEKHIRPIFRVYCVNCHGAGDANKGRLDVRLVRFLIKGGESGPAIKPGDPKNSNILDRIRSGEMPPGDKRLTDAEIAMVEQATFDSATR